MCTRALIIIAALAGTWLGTSPAAGSHGTMTFHVTVSGKGHDAATITAAEHGTNELDATGCVIVKQKATAILGAYGYWVRKVTGNWAALPYYKPDSSGVLLKVYHFRPTAATGTYRYIDVAGKFAINGHIYGGGASRTSIVKIRNGGRSGTWIEPQGHRNYPAQLNRPIPGFSIRATWHCDTVLHVTEKY